MKGISTVIAAVLLLMITVSLAAAAYVWFNSTFSATTQLGTKQIERSSQVFGTEFKIESVSADSIYVRNTGTADISNITVFVGNILANTTSPVIKPGEMAKITINSFVDYNASKTIKVTSGVGVGTVASIGPSQNYDTLVGYWKFDEGSGTVAQDSSGNGNTGTLVNGAIWDNGIRGSAVKLDGVNDMINVGNIAAFNSLRKFTVEAWIKSSVWSIDSSVGVILGKGQAGDATQHAWFYIRYPSQGYKLYMETGDSAGFAQFATGDLTWTPDQWYHVAAVFNNDGAGSTTVSFYRNGALISDQTITRSFDSGIDDTILGGNVYYGTHFFNGVLEDARLWNRTLSANEIAAHYLTEKP